MSVPYHLIGAPPELAEEFLLYCTDWFDRDEFEDELNDFGAPNDLHCTLLYGDGSVL